MKFPVLLAFLAACSGEVTDAAAPADQAATTDASDAKAKAAPARKEIPPPPDVAAPPSDATTTASGLAYKVLTPGTGAEKPMPFARVQVNYTGWSADGKMLDSTEHRGRPATFMLDTVSPGWGEALRLMVQGEKTRFWIPEGLRGPQAQPPGVVCYEFELVSISNPPAAPADVAAPPADAQKSASGLAYKILEPGSGDESPTKSARVMAMFTVWQTDGTVVESTVPKGRPLNIKLNEETMPGFLEALSLLKKGGRGIFCIPEELAYKGAADKPKGMLVYDLQLMSFENPVPPPPDVAAAPADAKKTASGLAYKILEKGKGGEKPGPTAVVTVHYTGWTTDGEMFDTSKKRGQPAQFPLDRVIPGWTEGLQLLSPGDKARLWIPTELAYNNAPRKPAGMLVFDVELVSFETPPPPPPAPPDVAAAPADAKKTESGLAYKSLSPGKGGEHPTAESRVSVHYTGWTTDGKMFDSSVTRGQPATFPLNGVIKGWTEGLQLMTVGEKMRFWIPADLAYGEKPQRPGAPAGTLVFDVELLEILPATPHGKAPPPPH